MINATVETLLAELADATVVARLRGTGALLRGKTNLTGPDCLAALDRDGTLRDFLSINNPEFLSSRWGTPQVLCRHWHHSVASGVHHEIVSGCFLAKMRSTGNITTA